MGWSPLELQRLNLFAMHFFFLFPKNQEQEPIRTYVRTTLLVLPSKEKQEAKLVFIPFFFSALLSPRLSQRFKKFILLHPLLSSFVIYFYLYFCRQSKKNSLIHTKNLPRPAADFRFKCGSFSYNYSPLWVALHLAYNWTQHFYSTATFLYFIATHATRRK